MRRRPNRNMKSARSKRRSWFGIQHLSNTGQNTCSSPHATVQKQHCAIMKYLLCSFGMIAFILIHFILCGRKWIFRNRLYRVLRSLFLWMGEKKNLIFQRTKWVLLSASDGIYLSLKWMEELPTNLSYSIFIFILAIVPATAFRIFRTFCPIQI